MAVLTVTDAQTRVDTAITAMNAVAVTGVRVTAAQRNALLAAVNELNAVKADFIAKQKTCGAT